MLTRLGFVLVATVVFVACSSELQEGDLRPAPISPQSLEFPTSTPLPTPTASPTPSPTPEPTATPEPTSTPTATERYGPLIVEGQYQWPRNMPNDLAEDELLAINIFASWQNARYASFQAGDASSPAVDTMRPYVGKGLRDLLEETVATYNVDGMVGSAPQPDNEWVTVEVSDRFTHGLVLATCEHVDTVITEVASGNESRAFGTSYRRIEFVFEDGTVRLFAWSAEQVERDEFSCLP